MINYCCRLVPLFALAILTINSLQAEGEVKSPQLAKKVETLAAAFHEGDFEVIGEMTHPMLKQLVGGEKAFSGKLQQAYQHSKKTGVTINSVSAEEPKEFFQLKEQSVCFIPFRTITQIGEQQIATFSFMIGAKQKDESEWLFLDGSALRSDPKLLWSFFPELPKDVKTPPNRIALVTAEQANQLSAKQK